MHSDDLHQRTDPDADPARHGRRTLKPSLGFVGAGKVGSVLARLLFARGYRVTTVYSRTFSHAETLAELVGSRAVASLADVGADLVLMTVPDDAIALTAAALAEVGFVGQAAVHTSGARDASGLASLGQRGVQVGSLHPAYPFADVETALKGLPGSAFAVEAGTEPLLGWLRELVAALDGHALLIPPGGKALYHAALVIASNYTVTLYALAEGLLTSLGADRAAADQALNALVAGTVENLRAQGIPDALTGPLVRVDVETIAAHLRALDEVNQDTAAVYRQLARLTYPLLLARGIAPNEIEQLLQQDVQHAHNSP
jgi:predicted short-subunit dehydrogenase-like oxidoreductase (DUF2520 family)